MPKGQGKRKANKWLQHLAQFRKTNDDMPPSTLMREARRSYQGGVPSSSMPTMPTMPTMASMQKLVKGGEVVPYALKTSESQPASLTPSVGGRRQTQRRQSRRKGTQRRRSQSRNRR